MASGYPMFGNRLSYLEYLTAQEFVDDISSASRDVGRRLSIDISRQTREVIASNEALAAENIRANEIAAGQITDALNSGFGDLSSTMQNGFTRLSYDMQEISAGIEDLNATFHWGFGEMIASMGRMNDSLTELIKIAKTPVQTAAFNHYEIARDAFRQGLYVECLESLDKAIAGDHTSTGYKLEWRFHQMKGTLRLGFVNGDMSLVDLVAAEESFTLAARYAKADYPDHAAQAFLSAGWAAYCQGKLKEGLAYTEQALALKPNLGEALFQAAKVRMALGEVGSALPILGKAIDVDRFYTLKAAGDGDFQQYDEKLRNFLDAMRKEKYRQAVPKVREALEVVQRILKMSTDGKGNKAVEKLEEFFAKGESWPLLDILAVVQGLDAVIAEAKRLPIAITLEVPHTVEETFQEQVSYQERVVVKPAGWFSKEVTEIQTKTRTETKKHIKIETSAVSFEFCAIPSGSFIMGTDAYGNFHGPAHQVIISYDYYIGKAPVTQAQWEAVIGKNPSKFKGDNHPVENVSWDDCQDFIKRLNTASNEIFRLPTEAEWEHACRAGSTGIYCFGDNEAQLGDYAWFSANCGMQTKPVGKKKPNAWGLNDMHGNVLEWCQDWHGDYPTGVVTDPQGASTGTCRVYRGGCGILDASYSKSFHRSQGPSDRRDNYVGFRLICASVR
jgi:formylglycine-generating enzyme required for sulfatase activity/tetratricopeptide (TPR) repeat protein